MYGPLTILKMSQPNSTCRDSNWIGRVSHGTPILDIQEQGGNIGLFAGIAGLTSEKENGKFISRMPIVSF